jgi:DME family drug/metabolite transporter
VSALDLGLGVTLFALSVRASGFDQAVVLVSSLPLFAQLIAWLSGAERPRPTEVAGAAAVVVAVAVALMA